MAWETRQQQVMQPLGDGQMPLSPLALCYTTAADGERTSDPDAGWGNRNGIAAVINGAEVATR